MKIAILSDIHLGYDWGTERQDDAFEALGEALEKVAGCDAILVAGDMFDTRIPGTEVLAKAMELLIKPLTDSSEAQITGGVDKRTDRLLPLGPGMPVIAIHGTHERRVRGLLNPVEALEKAGFLVYLHCNGIVLEKPGERVCIQGLSGVPDQFAETVLKQWNPKPMADAFNIFVLHQSIKQFMLAPNAIDVEALPKGFDFYVCGHMHESKETRYGGSPLLIPGSFIVTQLTKDAGMPRGFWILETGIPPKSNFVELESQRKVYQKTFSSGMDRELVIEELGTLLDRPFDKKPLVRINFAGKTDVPDTLLSDIRARFGEKAIIYIRKDIEEEKPVVRSIEEQRMSVQEMGRKALIDNLKGFNLDTATFESIFELILENKIEEAVDLLNRKTEE
jgi:DNA repair exonuclease SbcCD nuclease subunit